MKKKIRGALLLLLAVIVVRITAAEFLSIRRPLEIRKGPGVTGVKRLGDYFGKIKDTRGDTEVYFLTGERPGGTALILGGTHPNEPAGHVAAVLILENVKMDAGRLIVLPKPNGSGFTHNDPQEASPSAFSIDGRSGKRWFRYGSRSTSPMGSMARPRHLSSLSLWSNIIW